MGWLKDRLAQHYGSSSAGFERLTKIDENLSRFAGAKGREMSMGKIINIVCTLEQWQVKEAYKQAQKKFENEDAEKDDKFLESYYYWKHKFDNEDAMRALLSEGDKALIADLKARYGNRLNQINPIYERLNGLPLISNGLNYMPIVRKGEYDPTRSSNSDRIELFPGYFVPRIISLKEIDENANVLQVFANRTATDAHFIHFADIIFETQSLLGNRRLGKHILENLTREERRSFDWAIKDVLNGQTPVDSTLESRIARFFSSMTAYFGLALNFTSAAKQWTGAPAFLLKVPTSDYLKGFFNGDWWKSFGAIRNSPLMKDRRDSGEINQVLADFERTEREFKNRPMAGARRIIKKIAFAPTKWADALGFALGGASVYSHLLKQYRELYPEEEAKRLAMADVVNIGEMTQQSSFIMNMSESQRRSGGIGKMLSTFRTTNQQYLSFEIEAFNAWFANPNKETSANLAKTILLNHAILPAFFNGMGVLLNLALGDDWGEEDWEFFWENMAVSAFLDVFTGWWVSAILKGAVQWWLLDGYGGKISDSMVPGLSSVRIFELGASALKDAVDGDGFDWKKHLNKMLKTTTPLYRMGYKIYENATDGEDSVLYTRLPRALGLKQ